jgi:hypothetical protein
MVRSRWFETVELPEPATALSFFNQVESLLDRLQPAALATARSTVSVSTGPSSGVAVITAFLAHAICALADIRLHYGGPEDATLLGMTGLEEYYGNGGIDGPLDRVILDDLADLLWAEWEVEEIFWRGRRVGWVAGGRCQTVKGRALPAG